MDNLWLKVEDIVEKEEIACFEQFLLLSLCFQKAVCCRGVRKRLYEGKGHCSFLKQSSQQIWFKGERVGPLYFVKNSVLIEH